MFAKKCKFLSIIILLLMFGCSNSKEPICIGFSANLTGNGSDLGVSGMYGANIAISEINSNGGINGQQLYLNIKNDEANPNIALEKDNELINEGCPIIVGHMVSGVTKTVIPLINSSNYLMVSPTISTESLTMIDDNFIRLIPSNVNQIKALAEFIDLENLDTFGILYDSNNQLFADTFINWLDNASNGKVKDVNNILEFKSYENIDYINTIQEITQKGITNLLIISSGDIVAKFAQYFSKQNIKLNVLLPTWALSDSLIIKGGRNVEGFIGINFFNNETDTPEYITFKQKLLEEYNILPSFSSIMSYEAVMLIIDAMKLTSSTDPKIIKDHIVNSNSYNGILDDLVIDQYGDATRSIELYFVKDGQISRIKNK